MNKKSLTAFILAVVTILALGLSVACAKEKPVELENFEDVTVDADLGTAYALPSPVVYDKEGNEYTVTYTVKTASGADVKVASNQFTLAKFENYLILCSATITEKNVRTRTITVRVKDTGKPVVKIGEAKTGFVGTEYTFPVITVIDASGETIVPEIKLYHVDGENKTEVAVANGKFTPAARGTYSMTVTAKDSSGNTAEETVEFHVRNAMAENVFEDFDDEYGKYTLTNKGNGLAENDAEWLTEFEGKTGVIAAKSAKAYGPHQFFRFNMTTEELAAIDFEYVYADIYVTFEENGELASDMPVNIYSRNAKIDTITTGVWARIKITPEMIDDVNSNFSDSNVRQDGETSRECFNRVMTTGNGGCLFYAFYDGAINTPSAANKYTFYIGEIGWKPAYRIQMNLESAYDLGDYVTFNATVPNLSDYTVIFDVTAPSGKKVEVDDENKIRLTEIGQYTVKASIEHETEHGEKTYTFNVTTAKSFTVEGFTASGKQFEEIAVPAAKFEGLTVQPKVTISNVEVALTDGKFVPEFYGTYTVEYSCEHDGLKYREFKEIEVAKGASKANEVESFSGMSSIADVVIFNGQNHKVEWLAEFEGEKGVAKLSQNGTGWPAFTFVANQPMATYAEYDYLVLRAYLPSDVQSYNGVHLYNGTGAQYRNDLERGKWVDIVYDIHHFLDNWKDDKSAIDTLYARIFSAETTSDLVVLYVSDISVAKGAARSGITVEAKSAYDVPVVGKDLTFEVKNPYNYKYTFEVFAPDGSKVELVDGKTTGVKGNYRYKITCEGFLGEITGTVEVFEELALTVSGNDNAGKKGGEIVLPVPEVFYLGTKTTEAAIEVSVRYGKDVVALSNGKFVANYTGSYTVEYKVTMNEVVVSQTVTMKVMEDGALVVFDHENKLDTLFTETASTKEFIDAAKIAADETLPALPEGATGYVKVTGKANEWGTFAFGLKGDYFTADMLADSDYIDMTIYFAGANNLRLYWYNAKITDCEKGKWTTVRMPVSMFTQTQHGSRPCFTVEKFYEYISGEKLFDLYDWSKDTDETAYIASVKLVKEAAHAELGDKYVDFNKENWQSIFKVKAGTLAWSDEYNGILATDSGWINIFVKTERNFSEIHNYSKLRVTCKNVTAENQGIFVQNKFRTDSQGNEHVYFDKISNDDGTVYYELSSELLMKYYFRTYYGGDETLSDDHRALLIGNGTGGTFVITAIDLIK